ncbi:TPA: tail fiber protein [Yersinia enterocolitica]|uniref:phage tail protein n=1 Tax=Yersinia enterocolitica TaxID=630 RepID=UPI0025AB5B18|nr:phage tail protein [Yersinia enterocolitica]MDN0099426.1 phage tail protein [Yersinia enterocolitica]HDM8288077.1 tail fiber protein [Yersinia enterocolitica]HDM8428755.1 tail fiber protein [Yersinia enterocolitica]
MHRIDTPTAQVDKFGAGKNGFTRGNPQTGVPATALDDDYFDAVQEELAGVVEAAGFVLNKADRAQLLAAIKHLITLGIPDLKDASLTQKGVVQLSSSTTSVSEILAATPKAVKDMGDKALKTTNNLSEIAAAGSVAQATTQANIGLTPSKFSGRLLNTQTFTATGTYTATAGTNFVIVEQIGAGGASGAISATASNQNSITCPGSNGVYAKAKFTSGFNGALVSIGAGGQPRLGNGFDGGNTSFGSLLVCPGGTGSLVGNPTIPPGYTSPQSGTVAPTIDASGILLASEYGTYLQPAIMIGLGVASNYASWLVTKFDRRGMGGNGRLNGANGTQQQGVAGNDGYCIVWEYA